MLLGTNWYNYIPGTLVALTGLIYIALEFVPSIEPPANMRYVTTRRSRVLRSRVEDADTVQGRGRRLGCRAGIRCSSINQSSVSRSGEGARDGGCFGNFKGRDAFIEEIGAFERCLLRLIVKREWRQGSLNYVEERGYESHVERMLVWIRRTMVRLPI